MNIHFSFQKLVSLLGRSVNDPVVKNFFGPEISNIERDEYYGSLEFKPEGIDVVFEEAPWIVPSERVTDPKLLHIAAFHMHREGHEGFAGYPGQLPNGVALGDSETELLRKMGKPIRTEGDGASSLLDQPVPRWFWFAMGAAILHFQLDASGKVDMVTLQMPRIKLI